MDSVETFVKLRYLIMTPVEYLERVPTSILVKVYKYWYYDRLGHPCKDPDDVIAYYFEGFGLDGCFDGQGYREFKLLVHQALIEYHRHD